MALTATITLNRTTAPVGQKVTAVVVVSNSAGSPVTLTEIVPQIKKTALTFPTDASPVAVGKCRVDQTVPAAGSETYVFDVCFQSASTSEEVGCIIYSADGQTVSPTPDTISIT